MSISERTKKSMRELGLSENEIRSYLSLLKFEQMNANEISKKSNVPYSKVYEILLNLEQKGWVESDDSRPKNFKAKSPSLAIEDTKIRLESIHKKNENQILSELQPLYESKESLEKPEIWILRGENNITEKIGDTISKSKKEILIALPLISQSIAQRISPVLMYLESKGIKITILATEDSAKILKKFKKIAEIRARDKMFGGGIIADGKEVLLLLGSETEDGEPLAIGSEHLGLAKFAREYFEWLFKTSEKIN
jgi:sugar-specific transcriptional regulator TrmB